MKKIKIDKPYLYICVFLALCCLYFIHLQGAMPNPDTIAANLYYKNAYIWEVNNGRFIIGILQYLKGYVVNPTIATLCSFVLLIVICYFVNKILGIENVFLNILVCLLIILYPSIGCILSYYYCSDMYMLSFLCAVLSIYCLTKDRKIYWVISIFLIVVSLGIYQSFISVVMVLCALIIIKKLIECNDNNEIRGLILRCIVVGIVSILLYLVFNKIAISYCEIKQDSLRFANMGQIDINTLPEKISLVYTNFFNYYFGDSFINNSMCARKYINIISFGILVALLIMNAIRIYKQSFIKFCLFILINLLLPICFMVFFIVADENLLFGPTSPMILSSMNFLYIYIIVLANYLDLFNISHKYKTVLSIIICCGLVLPVYSMFVINAHCQSYYVQKVRKYESIADRLVERLSEYEHIPHIVILGSPENGNYPEQYQSLRDSVGYLLAKRGIIWEYGDYYVSTMGWIDYLKQYKAFPLYGPPAEFNYQEFMNSPEYNSMGVFPEKNSVEYFSDYGGIVVVKLSN